MRLEREITILLRKSLRYSLRWVSTRPEMCDKLDQINIWSKLWDVDSISSYQMYCAMI
jgi:hypothetical protein